MKIPNEFEDDSAVTIASFGTKLVSASVRHSLRDARQAAEDRLNDIVSSSHDECLATIATSEDPEDRLRDFEDPHCWKIWDPISSVMTASGSP